MAVGFLAVAHVVLLGTVIPNATNEHWFWLGVSGIIGLGIGDFGVLLHAGFKKSRALLFNFLSALTAVAGAITGLLIGTRMEGVAAFLVPLAAGGFIYIAGADLIPEMHKCETESLSKSFWQCHLK
jgi:zinc transporter ZupT